MLHGYLPYRDIFDHKPPLIYVWYAASFLLFGQNIVAPRILAALTWSATTFLVYVQGKLLLPAASGPNRGRASSPSLPA